MFDCLELGCDQLAEPENGREPLLFWGDPCGALLQRVVCGAGHRYDLEVARVYYGRSHMKAMELLGARTYTVVGADSAESAARKLLKAIVKDSDDDGITGVIMAVTWTETGYEGTATVEP